MSRNREGDIAFYLMGIGLYVFWTSLKKIKLHRRIKDTSTSKIASAALGDSVEIHAEVIRDKDQVFQSPLSGKDCVAFIWNLERRTGGKNPRWVLEKRYFSTPYVFVTDESKALAALDLSSCAFQEDLYGMTKVFNDNSYELPEAVLKILTQNKMVSGKKSFLFSEKYRLVEKSICPGDSFYILGTAGLTPASEKPHSSESSSVFGKRKSNVVTLINSAFNNRKSDPEMIQMYDRNGNMTLDPEEAEVMYSDVKKSVLKRYGASENPENYLQSCKFLFVKSKGGGLFGHDEVCVSSKTQSQLANSLAFSSLLGFFGGPAMFALGLWMFMNRINQ
ncbi:MAG: hypothetical protein V4598_05955 [Bdellovibrionota bacterium]